MCILCRMYVNINSSWYFIGFFVLLCCLWFLIMVSFTDYFSFFLQKNKLIEFQHILENTHINLSSANIDRNPYFLVLTLNIHSLIAVNISSTWAPRWCYFDCKGESLNRFQRSNWKFYLRFGDIMKIWETKRAFNIFLSFVCVILGQAPSHHRRHFPVL